jgi:hypothetical protein
MKVKDLDKADWELIGDLIVNVLKSPHGNVEMKEQLEFFFSHIISPKEMKRFEWEIAKRVRKGFKI